MGKYKKLKEEHDELKAKVKQLESLLLIDGSITKPRIFPRYEALYAGDHRYEIARNKDSIKILRYNQKLLENFLKLELKHTGKWEYVKKENTDE